MPFSEQEFLSVFARYNQAVWPLQIAAYAMGAIAVALLFWESRVSAIMIPTLLGALWAINGFGYHATFFAQINPFAPVFAALFLFQALFLGLSPLFFGDMRFHVRKNMRSLVGLTLIAYAMVAYPIWGRLVGQHYPAVPVFGIAPCPTTIFTVGILLFAKWRAARWLLVVPAVWAVIGGSAAFVLGMPQDWALIATLLLLAAFVVGDWRGQGRTMPERDTPPAPSRKNPEGGK